MIVAMTYFLDLLYSLIFEEGLGTNVYWVGLERGI